MESLTAPIPSPEHRPVRECRVCHSTRVADLDLRKRYHLLNLGLTLEVPYCVCLDCQFLFQGTYVGDAFLDYYYRHSPMLRRREPTRFELDQNERQGAFLARHVALEGRRVLEIGAHAGAFLVHLQERYKVQPYYDELSEEACRVLASKPGLLDFRQCGETARMDVIVVRHVIEHLFDLDAFLLRLREQLSPEGTVFIETPDWSYLDPATDPLIFEHLNQFPTHALIQLFRRHGWTCLAVEKSIHPDDPATPNRVQRLLFQPSALPAPGSEAFAGAARAFFTSYHNRLFGQLERLIASWPAGRRLAFYPASHLSFSALLEARLQGANLIGLYDIDTKKHGLEVCGVRIFPAEALVEHKPEVIVIFSMAYEREIRESFERLGVVAELVSSTGLVRSVPKP